MKSRKFFCLIGFVIIITLGFLVYKNIGFTYVVGASMENAISSGDILMINKNYEMNDLQRGDIAIFDIKIEGELERIIKRIVGVSGDLIEIKDNIIFVNGSEYKEDYLRDKNFNLADLTVEVPKGSVFVLGDNRDVSVDSRDERIGFIDFDKSIYGKVIEILNKKN